MSNGSVTFQFPEEEMQRIVSAQLVALISKPDRERLIADALEKMLRPEKPSYGSGPAKAPIQRAFENAIDLEVSRIIREMVSKDEAFLARLRTLVETAMGEVLAGVNSERLVEKLADGIMEALKTDY